MSTDPTARAGCGGSPESLRHQTPPWDCSVVYVCVGKVGTKLSQGSAGSLESEGPGVPSKKLELCPEGRGECQSQARKEEADRRPPPRPGSVAHSVEGTGGHLCSESVSAVD